MFKLKLFNFNESQRDGILSQEKLKFKVKVKV